MSDLLAAFLDTRRSCDFWVAWLLSNHATSDGVWLKISKKDASVVSVSYDQALDIALCFGWIDGQKKRFDETHFLQKFTHRRPNSLWSKRNVAKVGQLVDAGLMQPSGQAEVDAAKADGRWQRAYAPPSTIQVPDDFRCALEENAAASTFFESLNKTQRYSFLWRIETAKRADTRARRICQFVEVLAEGKTL